jgi:glycosyltransferase A (GT-A) superfamily protein (DUF2064 family)
MRARLSPPYAPEQAARIANAAVVDTLRAVEDIRVGDASPGWAAVAGDLDQAFSWPGPSLLVGVETPQLDPRLLVDSAALLSRFDAVVGPTTGDGWWAFGLRDPWPVMPVSLADTGSLTLAALRLGLRVAMLPALREINSAGDVLAVAELCPAGSRFAATAAALDADRTR